MSYFSNHEAVHAGRPDDRRERGCGLLWGRHCFHRHEGLFRMLAWWECCMCTRAVNVRPADQCALCEAYEKAGV